MSEQVKEKPQENPLLLQIQEAIKSHKYSQQKPNK